MAAICLDLNVLTSCFRMYVVFTHFLATEAWRPHLLAPGLKKVTICQYRVFADTLSADIQMNGRAPLERHDAMMRHLIIHA